MPEAFGVGDGWRLEVEGGQVDFSLVCLLRAGQRGRWKGVVLADPMGEAVWLDNKREARRDRLSRRRKGDEQAGWVSTQLVCLKQQKRGRRAEDG